MNILNINLDHDAAEFVSAMLRRLNNHNIEWFFTDFALESECYPEWVQDVMYSLIALIEDKQGKCDPVALERDMSIIGITTLALYDLTIPERTTSLSIDEDNIVKKLLLQPVAESETSR